MFVNTHERGKNETNLYRALITTTPPSFAVLSSRSLSPTFLIASMMVAASTQNNHGNTIIPSYIISSLIKTFEISVKHLILHNPKAFLLPLSQWKWEEKNIVYILLSV